MCLQTSNRTRKVLSCGVVERGPERFGTKGEFGPFHGSRLLAALSLPFLGIATSRETRPPTSRAPVHRHGQAASRPSRISVNRIRGAIEAATRRRSPATAPSNTEYCRPTKPETPRRDHTSSQNLADASRNLAPTSADSSPGRLVTSKGDGAPRRSFVAMARHEARWRVVTRLRYSFTSSFARTPNPANASANRASIAISVRSWVTPRPTICLAKDLMTLGVVNALAACVRTTIESLGTSARLHL